MGADSLFSRVKDMFSHVVDSFLPTDEEDDEEDILEQQASPAIQATQAAQNVASARRVANGGTVPFSAPSPSSSFQTPRTPAMDRRRWDTADGSYDEGG